MTLYVGLSCFRSADAAHCHCACSPAACVFIHRLVPDLAPGARAPGTLLAALPPPRLASADLRAAFSCFELLRRSFTCRRSSV